MKPLICLSVLIAATACSPTPKSPNAQRAEQIEARESAKRAYVWFHRQMVKSYTISTNEVSPVLLWSNRWMDADLRLAQVKRQKLNAIRAHEKRIDDVDRRISHNHPSVKDLETQRKELTTLRDAIR